MIRRSVVAGAVVALFACGSAFAQAVPKEMAWTAYDTGSSGFNIAVAIGQQFKQVYGSDVRILPSGNDTGRLSPVKANRAVISQMGIGIYFAQEGVFEFGTKSWGPQPARLMMAATACNGLGLAVAKDTGVKEVKDIKGKRVGVVVGSPALTQGVLALIAFAGLTEKDVTLVQFSSNNAMWKGIINNEADVALSSTISGQSKEADSSPRGIIWPPMPADDKEGWARVHKKAPYFVPVKATCGSGGLSPQTPDHHGELCLSDLHDLRRPAGRHDRRHHQGHDRHLQRLQGRCARRRGHGAVAAELPVGRAVPRWRHPRIQGQGCVDRRGAEAQ